MEKKPTSKILGAISFYMYFFSFLMAICLFVLPMTAPRPNFMNSKFIDVLVRCIFWLNFFFAYWSLSTAFKKQINGTDGYFLEMRRDISSLILLAVSAIGLGFGIWILTYWTSLIFVPPFAKEAVYFIAILNGLTYAILAFSRYFWLPESE